jgi:hypothetical protein
MGVVTSDDFVRHFFWKYVDMRLSQWELKYLCDRVELDPLCFKFLQRYERLLSNPEADVLNLCTVMSQLDRRTLEALFRFYVIRNADLSSETPPPPLDAPKSYDALQQFIGEDDARFERFVISLYYYF